MEIDKVCRGLECLIHMTSCIGCPYWDSGRTRKDCLSHIGKDAIAMLKELEEKYNKLAEWAEGHIVFCKDCKHYDRDENSRLGTCLENGVCSTPDWFCADGERESK